jgi:hypothetical protein
MRAQKSFERIRPKSRESKKERTRVYRSIGITSARAANEGEIESHETLPSVHLLSWISITLELLSPGNIYCFNCIVEEEEEEAMEFLILAPAFDADLAIDGGTCEDLLLLIIDRLARKFSDLIRESELLP